MSKTAIVRRGENFIVIRVEGRKLVLSRWGKLQFRRVNERVFWSTVAMGEYV
jgi:hypothetical protein